MATTRSGGNSLASRDVASLLHPYTDLRHHQQNGPALTVRKGDGIRVYDENGKAYIDAAAGLWSASLGFSNERLAQAAYRQMQELPFYHAFTGKTSEPMVELAEMLLARAPVPMGKVFFANSGSEANDTAVKIVWYANNARGKPAKKKLISRLKAYHGVTVAAASLTGLPNNHRQFDLPLPGFLHTMTPHHYHNALPDETEEAFATRCADELEKLILAEGPETVAAFIAEPIMGAGGVLIPPRGYFEKIQAVLKRYDVYLIADEVVCGFGRTGAYWGSETFSMQPDIITCAKALSASFLPISGVMVSQALFDITADQSRAIGTFGHGYTYSGHPVTAAVAVETLKIYDEIDVVGRGKTLGAVLQSGLRQRFENYPLIGEVRGTGFIGAIELIADKTTHKNFDPSQKMGPKLAALCEEEGLITRALPNDTIAFSPPFIIDEAEINDMLDRAKRALDRLSSQI